VPYVLETECSLESGDGTAEHGTRSLYLLSLRCPCFPRVVTCLHGFTESFEFCVCPRGLSHLSWVSPPCPPDDMRPALPVYPFGPPRTRFPGAGCAWPSFSSGSGGCVCRRRWPGFSCARLVYRRRPVGFGQFPRRGTGFAVSGPLGWIRWFGAG